MHRLLKAYETEGTLGLVSKKRQQPSNRRHSEDIRNAVLDLVRERYVDFGPTLAREELIERHQLAIGKETLRQWMTEAGIWISRRERKKRVFQPRGRRDCFGELVQIDGSHHWWFENRGPKCALLVYIDDATGSYYICALRDLRTLSIICTRQRPICSNGVNRWLFIATSMASFALRTLREKIEPVG